MNSFYTENNVVFCKRLTDIEYLAHGFSTRSGGVSEVEYTKSLNLGYCRGDDDMTVNKNREIFARAAGLGAGGLAVADQVHGTNIEICDGSKKHYGACDGFVSVTPGVFLSVKTADCQPILFADKTKRIVGACHAGWRGTMNGIAAKTAEKMISLGADKSNIVAALGPCICADCFTVKEDFIAAFEASAPGLLKFIYEKDGVYHADISAMNRAVLLSAGLKDENICVCGECTCCDGEKYYSHRRQKGHRGSMMNVIGIL